MFQTQQNSFDLVEHFWPHHRILRGKSSHKGENIASSHAGSNPGASWKIHFLCTLNCLKPFSLTKTGYSNTFTNPKSSPVAKIFLSLVKSTAFTSVMSECGGQIPAQSSPRTLVHVNQSTSLALLLAIVCRVPRGASKKRRSLAPELV